MRFPILAAALLAALPAHADPNAIQGVIGDQITAFRADDFDQAFTFAAPSIQGMFGNSQNFGQMVRQGYPMVWKPGRVEYLGTEELGAVWQQDVLITDEAGRLHSLRYSMVQTDDGWRIAGVELLRAPEVGA